MTGSPRVDALVLAAGSSRRMGSENKLVAPVDGKPMLQHVLEAVRRSRISELIVVTGHDAGAVRSLASGLADRVILNPRHLEGLSTSMIAGLDALSDEAEAVLVCLGDMPRLTHQHLDRLIAAFDTVAGREICVPVHGGERGNPVLWGRRFFYEMRQVTGDRGARMLMETHPEALVEVEMDDDAVLRDVDTPEALAALRGLPAAPDQER